MAKKMIRPGDAGAPDPEEFALEMQGFAQEAEIVAETQKAARVVAFQEAEERIDAAVKIVDIVKRAEAISEEIRYVDIRKVRMGDMFISTPENTDTNKRIVLDYLFKGAEQLPHFDEFRGRIVDHRGTIIDDFYDGTEYLDAYNAVGLRKLKLKEVIDAVRAYALRHRQNDLKVRLLKLIPEWDGVERMETSLINMFETHSTPLNRMFSKYFWLSLFCRCMYPGEEAPIVLTLIGVQNCGKSYFGKLLARLITGDMESDSVQLDLGANKTDFLREITGQSVVASVGEMTGFNRGDLNKIKDFVTRTHDKFSYKFEGVVHQARQWITVMDANSYEGLLRDDSGNRRFYPMFCGQLPDVAGKQQWRKDYKADFTPLRSDLWMLLAEARAWIDAHGLDDYRQFVRGVSKEVFDFSLVEMANDRGTISDEVFDTYLVEMLKTYPGKFLWRFKSGGGVAVGLRGADFKMFFQDSLKHVRPNWRHLKTKMLALGAEEKLFTGGYYGYLFPKITSLESFDSLIGVKDYVSEDGEEDGSGSTKRSSKVSGF